MVRGNGLATRKGMTEMARYCLAFRSWKGVGVLIKTRSISQFVFYFRYTERLPRYIDQIFEAFALDLAIFSQHHIENHGGE